MTENERRVRATNGDTYWEACAMLGDRDSLPNQLRRDVVDVEIAYAALAKAREVRP